MTLAASASKRAVRIGGILDAALLLLVLGFAAPWLATCFDARGWLRLAWLFDLASHWQWLFSVATLIAVLLRTWQGARHRLWLLALLALPWFSASPRLPTVDAASGQPKLRIAAINLLISNKDPAGLRAFLDAVKPDIAVLTELHPNIARAAGTWADYPERYLLAEDSPFGIGVLSRLPLQDAQSHLDASGLPEIDVRLVWNHRPVLLTALHPMPPLSADWHQARGQKLRAVAARQQSFPGARLLVGDLNTSPWSAALVPLTPAYRRANTLRATWPSQAPSWLGIPIDLILASKDWSVDHVEIAPAFGSDHHPVWADLVLTDADAPEESP